MAINNCDVYLWPTGSDNNSGGFLQGGSGTDYSQQASAQFTGTNLTVDATTNTDVTPDGHSPVAADVGNLIYISTSTGGWTRGNYAITSIVGGKWRLDRSPAATTTSSGVWALGGALASFGMLGFVMAQCGIDSTANIKDGTYTCTSNSVGVSGGTVSTGGSGQVWRGYLNTPGDGLGTIIITTTAASSVFVQTGTGVGLLWQNLTFDGASLGSNKAFDFVKAYWRLENCVFKNFAGVAVNADNSMTVDRCEFTNCSSSSGVITLQTGATLTRCYLHANSAVVVKIANNAQNVLILDNIIAANTGGTTDGIQGNGNANVVIQNNTIDSNGRDGIHYTLVTNYDAVRVTNNIFSNHTAGGAFGINVSATESGVTDYYNAYYNNTANTQNIRATDVEGQVILTSTPYNNAGGGDYGLNITAGGGLACRGTGIPGTFPAGLSIGYRDRGAVQSQASAPPPPGSSTTVATWET